MATHYGSFLIRYWRLGGGEQRVDVEHMQSGGRARLNSLAEALDWMSARCRESALGGRSESGTSAAYEKQGGVA